MSAVGLPALAVLLPLLAALAAWLSRSAEAASWLAIAGATAAFAVVAALPWLPEAGAAMLADPLAVHMAVLTAFVAMTGAWFARAWWRAEAAEPATARRGHALYPALLAMLLLGLLADDVFLAWGGMAAAVLLLVTATRLARPQAGAGLFLAGGAALALGLLGTLLLTLAALPVLGPQAEGWTLLTDAAPHAQGALLTLGFVFLLLGYGTLAGLVPLHGAMLAVLGAGPAPLAGVLGGLLPGVALVAILRARALLAANPEAMSPGPALLAFGLLSLVLAALTLRRQRDAQKFIAVAGMAQVGVVAFAFGLGGGAATFSGVLHLTLLTLLRAALVFAAAHAMRSRPGGDLRGLLPRHPALGLTLVAGLVALAGVPPFGLFTSAFLIVMQTTRQAPLLAVPLGLGLAAGAWALAGRVVSLCADAPEPQAAPAPPPVALLPAWLHLAVVLLLGLAMPGAAVEWLARIAEALR